MDLTNPLVYGVPAFCAFVLAELAYTKSHEKTRDVYEWKDLGASIVMGAGAVLLGPLIKIIGATVLFTAAYEWFNPEVNGVRTNVLGYASFGWAWYVWLICQVLDDFTYYWFHRLNHTVRFLWAAHIVHHSSEKFNFGTGLRNGWITLLYKPLFYVWLPIIGFHPAMVIFCLGIESLWQFQLHTQFIPKLGFLEKFLNTYTQHQAHHAQNLEYLDKNHGGYLNIFDKIFGSWVDLDDTVEVKYGVVHPPKSHNPAEVLIHEYRDIWHDIRKTRNPWNWFMYTFGPPGWSHDGSTKTVRQMQREARLEQLRAAEEAAGESRQPEQKTAEQEPERVMA